MKKEDIEIPEFMEDFRVDIDPSYFETETEAETLSPEENASEEMADSCVDADDWEQEADDPYEEAGKERNREKKVEGRKRKKARRKENCERKLSEGKAEERNINEGKTDGRRHTGRTGRERKADGERRSTNNSNRSILASTWFFVLLFVALILRFAGFIYFESSQVVNNSYNQRQEVLAQTVVRGKILSKDGDVLAETKTSKKGKELRYYPYGELFCHVVGRTEHGKTGIELSQSIHLLTSGTNLFSRIVTQLNGEKLQGNNVITTLDVNLQKAASDALGSQKGAVVVLEPSTGKILAMVSKSGYDPNTLSENWETLSADNENTPLINRATQGLYPPGSSFKVLTSLAFIEQKNYKDYLFQCPGRDIYSSVSISCFNGTIHGQEDLTDSFANSCNTSFANIGTQLDMEEFRSLCERCMFNEELPTEFACAKSSFVLSGASEKSEIPQTAIGQGNTQISPFHNAMLAAAIANQGVVMKPYLIDSVETANHSVVMKNEPESYRRIMTKKEARLLQYMMREVVKRGTATQLQSSLYEAAGKTGSAEFNSRKDTHAWFIGYAGKSGGEKPDIAISVLVENSGSGGVYAVPVAKKVFDAYYAG